MDIQSGILQGITSISSNDLSDQEYITEDSFAEDQEEKEYQEEDLEEDEDEKIEVNTVSGNKPEEGSFQYIVLESGEVEPLEMIDYTAPLIVLCLFVGICAGCLLFLAFGRGLTHGD